MQTTTTRPDTTTPIVIPISEDVHLPAYLSVTACPACNGDGEYEGIAAIQSPTATEPRYDVYPCEVCGAHDRPGTGYLRVLRCATCDGVIRQDTIEDVAAADADFEAQLAAIDPEEELLWQRSRDLSRNDLDRVTFCDCGAEDIEATENLISRVVALAVTQVQQREANRDLGLFIMTGVHGVPFGVLMHLTPGRVTLWKKADANRWAHPHRASGELRIGRPDGRTAFVSLFQKSAEPVQADHAAWAVDAGLADTVTSDA